MSLGLNTDPDSAVLLADKRLLERELDDASFRDAVARVARGSPSHANGTGVNLFRSGRHGRGLFVFEHLLSLYPQSVTTWTNLAITHILAGRWQDAQEAFARALSIDPYDDFACRSHRLFEQGALTKLDALSEEEKFPRATGSSGGR